MNKKNEWNVMERVWFESTYGVITTGFIVDIQSGKKKGSVVNYAKVKIERPVPGLATVRLSECYHTLEGLKEGMKRRHNSAVDAYKSEIKDVNDLVRFLLDHPACICEEYTDWDAREAAIQRAHELNIPTCERL